ncbi:hypothetical protein B0H13DRAFT_1856317 [Mycena leptocephala]|nr:hypothetical protein B0H13DRAFT_1856317 [Mycena leptocephala]
MCMVAAPLHRRHTLITQDLSQRQLAPSVESFSPLTQLKAWNPASRQYAAERAQPGEQTGAREVHAGDFPKEIHWYNTTHLSRETGDISFPYNGLVVLSQMTLRLFGTQKTLLKTTCTKTTFVIGSGNQIQNARDKYIYKQIFKRFGSKAERYIEGRLHKTDTAIGVRDLAKKQDRNQVLNLEQYPMDVLNLPRFRCRLDRGLERVAASDDDQQPDSEQQLGAEIGDGTVKGTDGGRTAKAELVEDEFSIRGEERKRELTTLGQDTVMAREAGWLGAERKTEIEDVRVCKRNSGEGGLPGGTAGSPTTCSQRLPSSVQRDFRTNYRKERKLGSNQLRMLIWTIGMATEVII